MGIINKVEDQQGTRTHCLVSFKVVIEDWMLEKMKEKKKNLNK